MRDGTTNHQYCSPPTPLVQPSAALDGPSGYRNGKKSLLGGRDSTCPTIPPSGASLMIIVSHAKVKQLAGLPRMTRHGGERRSLAPRQRVADLLTPYSRTRLTMVSRRVASVLNVDVAVWPCRVTLA